MSPMCFETNVSSFPISARMHVLAGLLVFLVNFSTVQAQDACGTLSGTGEVTCNADTYTAGENVSYLASDADNLSVTLDNVEVEVSDGIGVMLEIDGSSSTGSATLRALGGSITTTNHHGVVVRYEGEGSANEEIATIISSADITGRGTGRDGIQMFILNTSSQGNARIEVTGAINGADDGIAGQHRGDGNVNIQVLEGGQITAADRGIDWESRGEGNVNIQVIGGQITSGDQGIWARHIGTGDIAITTRTNITTRVDRGSAIYSEIDPRGDGQGGNVNIDVQGGRIVTGGEGAHGIAVVHEGTQGQVMVQSMAEIITEGMDAHGISVSSPTAVSNSLIVGSTIMGGSGMGRALYLSNGGTVTLRGAARVQAGSGIAIESAQGQLVLNVGHTEQIQGEIWGVQDATTIQASGTELLRNGELVFSDYFADRLNHDGILQAMGQTEGGLGRWEFASRASSRSLAISQSLLNLTRPGKHSARGRMLAKQGDGGTIPWLSVEGRRGSYEASASTTGLEYDQSWFRVRWGLEAQEAERVAGLSLHYVDSETDSIRSPGMREIRNLGATVDISGVGAAAYLRVWNADGLYVDMEGAGTWYGGEVSATGRSADLDAFGYSLSAELGREITWLGDWLLTPQLQLSYAQVDVDRVDGPFAAAYDKVDSIRTRLGVSAERTVQWRAKEARTYGSIGAEHEFDGQAAARVGQERVAARLARTWGTFSLGGSVRGKGPELLQRIGVSDHEWFAELTGAVASSSHEWGFGIGLRLHF